MTHENIFSQLSIFGFQRAEPVLYSELARYQRFMRPKWVEQQVNSWEELERREPARAKEWFDRVRKIENSYCKKMGLPSDERKLKDAVVEAYNINVTAIDTLHRDVILGNVESIFRLSSYYLVGDGVPQDRGLAFKLLRYAAEQGFEMTFPLLAECYAKRNNGYDYEHR